MATPPNRRELVLDNGRVFIETPRLMTDVELADTLGCLRRDGSGSTAEKASAAARRSAVNVARVSQAQAAAISPPLSLAFSQ